MTVLRHSILCVAAILVVTSVVAAQETDEVTAIIEQTAIDGDPIAMSGYSYEMKFERIKRLFFGRSRLRRTYRAVLPTRIPVGKLFNHPLLLVYDSSRNLKSSDIVAERNRIIARLDDIDAATISENKQVDDSVRKDGYMTLGADMNTVGDQALRIDLLRLLNSVRFSDLKRFELDGRKTISLRFEPSPTEEYSLELFYLKQIEGIIFIDETDMRVIKVEGYPVGRYKKYGSMPEEKRSEFRVFYFLQQRMPEGVWFPKTAEINFLEFPDDFKGLAVKVGFSFSNYKSFSTGVERLDIEDIEETEANPDDGLPQEGN